MQPPPNRRLRARRRATTASHHCPHGNAITYDIYARQSPMSLAVREYETTDGEIPFRQWLATLDQPVRARIQARVLRFEAGNLGDHKSVGAGVLEARIMTGPRLPDLLRPRRRIARAAPRRRDEGVAAEGYPARPGLLARLSGRNVTWHDAAETGTKALRRTFGTRSSRAISSSRPWMKRCRSRRAPRQGDSGDGRQGVRRAGGDGESERPAGDQPAAQPDPGHIESSPEAAPAAAQPRSSRRPPEAVTPLDRTPCDTSRSASGSICP